MWADRVILAAQILHLFPVIGKGLEPVDVLALGACPWGAGRSWGSNQPPSESRPEFSQRAPCSLALHPIVATVAKPRGAKHTLSGIPAAGGIARSFRVNRRKSAACEFAPVYRAPVARRYRAETPGKMRRRPAVRWHADHATVRKGSGHSPRSPPPSARDRRFRFGNAVVTRAGMTKEGRTGREQATGGQPTACIAA